MSALAEQLLKLHATNAAHNPETAALLALHLRENTRVTDDGDLVVVDAAGNPRLTSAAGFPNMTIAELLTEARETMPVLFEPKPADVAKQETAETLSMTQRMRAAKIARDAADAVARKPSIDTTPNPFSKNSFNISRQMILLKSDPVLANQMKEAAIAEQKK